MSLVKQIKSTIFQIIDDYENNSGVGFDQYHSEPAYHPMAEGKYLTSIAYLYRAKFIERADYFSKITKSLERLSLSNLSTNPTQACWGLGFSYKETDETEPFLITTSIIAEGLLNNSPNQLTKNIDNPELQELIKRTLDWLENYRWSNEAKLDDKIIKLPYFSPNTPIVVINAIAYWINVINTAKRMNYYTSNNLEVEVIVEWIFSHFTSFVGRTYSNGNNRVDLLHQFYIINSLFNFSQVYELEDTTINIFNNFYHYTYMTDKLDVVYKKSSALYLCQRSGLCSLQPGHNLWLVKYAHEARLWSYGEVLVALAKFAAEGKYKSYWMTVSKRIVQMLMTKYNFENGFDYSNPYKMRFRETMHLLQGLVNLLIVLSNRTRFL